ncbi:hypothetical protein J6590_026418 [Homalodisca vitripennis]|nr:hypothetical protein J6590_026418 [Homalodisca vitripennis]
MRGLRAICSGNEIRSSARPVYLTHHLLRQVRTNTILVYDEYYTKDYLKNQVRPSTQKRNPTFNAISGRTIKWFQMDFTSEQQEPFLEIKHETGQSRGMEWLSGSPIY